MKKLGIIFLVLIGVLAISIIPNLLRDKVDQTTISDKFMKLDVIVKNAEVDILPSDREQAEIHLSNKKNDHNLHVNVKGDVLEVEVKDKRFFRFFQFDLFSGFSQPTLTVYLPERIYDSVQIETDNGKVAMDELKTNELLIESDNGEINLTNIHSSTITTKSDNGRIMMDRVEGDISANTDNGRIIMDQVEGNIVGKSDNGKITLITKSLDRSIDLETDNGAIELETEEEPTNNTFDIQTKNGRITVFESTTYDTIIGDGEHLIKLKTDNGSIKVNRK